MTIVPVDDYSPVYAGDTLKPFVICVLHKNGFESLLGATISMHMQNVDDPSIIKTCSGPWVVDVLDNGRASYAYQATDVDTAGQWRMWVKIVIGGKTVHLDDGAGNTKILVIEALPTGV